MRSPSGTTGFRTIPSRPSWRRGRSAGSARPARRARSICPPIPSSTPSRTSRRWWLSASQGRKDALTFIEETGEFVCNLATFELRDAVNETSAPLARGESEMTLAGLTPAPSRLVKPPRVAEAPAALECRHLQTVPLTPLSGAEARYFLVIGRSGRNPHRRAFHRRWPRRHGRDAADHAGRLSRLLRGDARHALRHDTPARRLGAMQALAATKKAGVSRPLRHFT